MSGQLSNSTLIPVQVGHGLPKGEDPRLSALLGAALRKRFGPSRKRSQQNLANKPLWAPETFELPKCRAWREMASAARERVLRACNRQVLREAWLIEKAGMTYAAKMILLSESLEEQQLYCAIASEEAAHFAALEPWVEAFEARQGELDAFHKFLARMIEGGQRRPLILLIQVLLEGWGLYHYRELAERSSDPALRDVLQEILEDEGRHHGSGLVLLRDQGSFESAEVKDFESAFTSAFLEFSLMVRLGPQGVASAIRHEFEKNQGPMGLEERIALFEDLECENHSQRRLDILRELASRAVSSNCLAALDQAKAFRPMSAAECASL